ncbi:MAG: translation initiation factor IF-2 subunit gamma [Candidatus Woesearchaeota archaeon]
MPAKKTTKKAPAKKAIKKVPVKKASKKAVTHKHKPSSADDEYIQPVVNIGLVGHVDHGKTTLTQALSGRWADTHSEEIKRGITIRLGYADAEFRYDEKHKRYTVEKEVDGVPTVLKRKVSFVDAPGHESLMATMLAGARIMDGAMLLIAANEACPQPQTREHLMALQMSGIKNIVIVQNKIDLVDKERATRNYKQIKEFLKGTEYENAPIIPISAQHRVNIDSLIEAIEEFIPTPDRSKETDPMMFIARSFDINKPGTLSKEMKGGVLGGALVQGTLKAGDIIEIRPGRVVEEANQLVAKPLTTKIVTLMTGGKNVPEATTGGTIAALTTLDPGIVKGDSLVGNIVGYPGKLPPIWRDLRLEVHLLERVVGAYEDMKVDPLKANELLMLNVNSAATVGVITDLQKNKCTCKLKLPVCAELGARVAVSRRIGTRFRLIGYGIIVEKK